MPQSVEHKKEKMMIKDGDAEQETRESGRQVVNLGYAATTTGKATSAR
jgi:hypothetical protein